MSNIWLQIASGVVIGIIATLATLIIFHWLVSPRIQYSSKIRVHWLTRRKRFSYSIKMKKGGLVHLIDTTMRCRLCIRDVSKVNSRLWNYFDIPTSFSNSLLFRKGDRIVHLKLHEAKISNLSHHLAVQTHVWPRYPDAGMRFEDFFVSYDDVYIKLFLIGHDRFTGVKKLYESPKYRFHTLREGQWESGSLDLMETEQIPVQ